MINAELARVFERIADLLEIDVGDGFMWHSPYDYVTQALIQPAAPGQAIMETVSSILVPND